MLHSVAGPREMAVRLSAYGRTERWRDVIDGQTNRDSDTKSCLVATIKRSTDPSITVQVIILPSYVDDDVDREQNSRSSDFYHFVL